MLIVILITNILILAGILIMLYKSFKNPVAASTMEPIAVSVPKKEVIKKAPVYLSHQHSVNLAKRLLDKENQL